jgi:toxin FitB
VNWLLDTNVVSEHKQKRRNARVIQWLDSIPETELFVSAITIAEFQRGIVLLPDSPKRRFLFSWLHNEVPRRFAGRILPVDDRVAFVWGNLVSAQQMKGRSIPVLDSLVAATAMAHQFTLATRNVADLRELGLDLFNPWTDTMF